MAVELVTAPPISPAAGPRPDQLRVLMVTPRFHPFTGGVESHVAEVARRLAAAGQPLTILTTDPGGGWPVDESREGYHVHRVRAWPRERDYYFAPGVADYIMRGPWDVVHVQSYHTLVAPLAMAAAWRAGLPYVVTFHGGGHSARIRQAFRRVQRLALRPLLAQARRLVAVAEFEVALYGRELRLGPERFAVIPNGSELPAPSGGPARTGTLIVSVGRLERYKGHHRILAALPYVLREQPDARLWIVGAGPYEAELRQQAARLGMNGRVKIQAIPPEARPAMAAALGRAQLVVLLSEFETHPIAVLEALALGRPVLVADTSGLSALARQGWASAVPLHSSPAEVAQAVLRQLRHPLTPPALRLPSWDDCAADLGRLYATLREEPVCGS